MFSNVAKRQTKKKHVNQKLLWIPGDPPQTETFIFVDFPGPPGFLPTKFDEEVRLRNSAFFNDPNTSPTAAILPEELLVPRLRAPTWPRGARPRPPPPPNAAAHAWPQPLGNPGAAPRDLVANGKNEQKCFKSLKKLLGMSFGML